MNSNLLLIHDAALPPNNKGMKSFFNRALKGSLASFLALNCVWGDITVAPAPPAPGAISVDAVNAGVVVGGVGGGVVVPAVTNDKRPAGVFIPTPPSGTPVVSVGSFANCVSQLRAAGRGPFLAKDDLPLAMPLSTPEATGVEVCNVVWQMSGAATFIKTGAAFPAPVYIGAKRSAPSDGVLTQNNPAAGGALLNYNTDIHTERQLAIVALENAYGGLNVVDAAQNGFRGAPGIVAGAFLAPADGPEVGELGAAGPNGHLHIYTTEIVCAHPNTSNGNYSCLEYYADLLNACPKLNIHLYCDNSKTWLKHDVAGVLGSSSACIAVLDAINDAMNAARRPAGTPVILPAGNGSMNCSQPISNFAKMTMLEAPVAAGAFIVPNHDSTDIPIYSLLRDSLGHLYLLTDELPTGYRWTLIGMPVGGSWVLPHHRPKKQQ
ncbi:MAG: hypothetical protein LBJ89_03055 [Holosporales bacterium]|jgi:hypothetical protein|nr:hypothetical protein [Holosporales bacterium]